jgi:hypothetical protein
MAMKVVKKTKEHIIFERGDKRYAVKTIAGKQAVNGDDKIAILSAEGLLKIAAPKKQEAPAAEPADEVPAEAPAAEDAAAAETGKAAPE